MRLQPDLTSPWRRRVWIETHEFGLMMDELRRRAGVVRHVVGIGIDVDAVIERGIGADTDYVPLPPGVLGQTRFFRDGSVRIEISCDLATCAETDRNERRRLRSTMAHECGHVACHTCLHAGDTETLSLFAEPTVALAHECSPIMCREEAMRARYSGEWWEYQANQCMAALLLPRDLFITSTEVACSRYDASAFEGVLQRGHAKALIYELADEYDVNPTVALYRLESMGFVPDVHQRRMRLLEQEVAAP